jgi:hypothetical protein
MKYLVLLLIPLFISCSLTKEERRMNRATKKLEKLTDKFPELLQPDTIIVPVELFTDRVQIDTLMQITTDTVTIQKDNLTVRWLVRNDSIWVDAVCDTIFIYKEIKVPVQTIQPKIYEPSSKNNFPWWIWVVIGVMGVVIIGLVFRR